MLFDEQNSEPGGASGCGAAASGVGMLLSLGPGASAIIETFASCCVDCGASIGSIASTTFDPPLAHANTNAHTAIKAAHTSAHRVGLDIASLGGILSPATLASTVFLGLTDDCATRATARVCCPHAVHHASCYASVAT